MKTKWNHYQKKKSTWRNWNERIEIRSAVSVL